MGKKKDRKAAKAARAACAGGTVKVARISLPDELLKQGAALLEKANSPAGREMIAAGLTMAAAAASAALAKRGAKAAPEASDATATPASPEQPATARPADAANDPPVIADALGQAADALLKRFLGPKAG